MSNLCIRGMLGNYLRTSTCYPGRRRYVIELPPRSIASTNYWSLLPFLYESHLNRWFTGCFSFATSKHKRRLYSKGTDVRWPPGNNIAIIFGNAMRCSVYLPSRTIISSPFIHYTPQCHKLPPCQPDVYPSRTFLNEIIVTKDTSWYEIPSSIPLSNDHRPGIYFHSLAAVDVLKFNRTSSFLLRFSSSETNKTADKHSTLTYQCSPLGDLIRKCHQRRESTTSSSGMRKLNGDRSKCAISISNSNVVRVQWSRW